MRRYTTPSIMLTVKGVDLTTYDVYVTITQGSSSVTVENPDAQRVGCNTVLTIGLTQEQSAQFSAGMASVQVNWVDIAGNRDATVIKHVPIGTNLLEGVI